MWKLWLERNSRIFKGKATSTKQVVSKITGILGDCLNSLWNDSYGYPLSSSKETWIHSITPNLTKGVPIVHKKRSSWVLKIDDSKLNKWMEYIHKRIILFDGTSKGNQGAAGEEGFSLPQKEIKK